MQLKRRSCLQRLRGSSFCQFWPLFWPSLRACILNSLRSDGNASQEDHDFSCQITRARFEELVKEHLQQSLRLLKDAMEESSELSWWPCMCSSCQRLPFQHDGAEPKELIACSMLSPDSRWPYERKHQRGSARKGCLSTGFQQLEVRASSSTSSLHCRSFFSANQIYIIGS